MCNFLYNISLETYTGWVIWSNIWVWLTLIYDFSLACPIAQPLLPNSLQPKQNQVRSGTIKMKVNPPQLSDQVVNSVKFSKIYYPVLSVSIY